ncbi:MAG: hypothetical protein K0S32_1514 [Bacteroidetes bacterium]|jgi:hypothetical protein|nr:hypothetical protein [Bacteroidota bacterium]
MAQKNHINDNELNETLKEFFLNENSASANDDLAEFILKKEYNVKIDKTKERTMLNKLSGRNGSGGYGLFLSMLLFVIVLFITLSFLKTNEKVKVVTGSPAVSVTENGSPYLKNTNSDPAVSAVTSLAKNLPEKDTFGKMIVQAPFFIADTPQVKEAVIRVQKETKFTPVLTEEDKTRYKKVKEMMLQKLYKSDKGLYTHIDADEMYYNGKKIETEAYTMRNMGITNLEYKTFLADLLTQNRDVDYITAQVLPATWGVYGYIELANSYFREEKYNDFPVVNITIDGAKLFCRWLEEEIKIYIRQNNLKEKPLTIRLPYDTEWLYAARNGFARIAFEGGYNTIFDISEGMIDKTTMKRLELVRKRVKKNDSLFDLVSANHYGWNEKDIITLFGKGLKYYSTFPVDTIYPDRMKTFGKAGHVAEIICEKRTNKIWFIGTSWKNKEDYLKLQNEFRNTNASPFVGFRPVIINSNDPVHKNPFW